METGRSRVAAPGDHHLHIQPLDRGLAQASTVRLWVTGPAAGQAVRSCERQSGHGIEAGAGRDADGITLRIGMTDREMLD